MWHEMLFGSSKSILWTHVSMLRLCGLQIGVPPSYTRNDTTASNYLVGSAIVTHNYKNAKKDANTPWTAYFTGGNRITYTTAYLRNNDQGRFRIESTVNLNFPADVPNRSPILYSLPILPIPYTGRGDQSAFGMLATFQVSAS